MPWGGFGDSGFGKEGVRYAVRDMIEDKLVVIHPRSGVTQVGTVLSLPGGRARRAGGLAFDLAWIDLEHGALSVADAQALAIGLAAAGCEAHVRLPGAAPSASPR